MQRVADSAELVTGASVCLSMKVERKVTSFMPNTVLAGALHTSSSQLWDRRLLFLILQMEKLESSSCDKRKTTKCHS